MSKLSIVKPSSAAEKSTRTTVDTLELTQSIVSALPLAPFQRPLRVNAKVLALAEEIRRDGVIPGILTIGSIGNQRYLVDGQHRIEAFKLAQIDSAYADVRTLFFGDMGEMGREFVRINSHLVTMRPDDIIRGLEASYEALRRLRQKVKFLGYDMIRRSEKAPLLSMSLALRMWRGATAETPVSGGASATELATTLTDDQADELSGFLNLCFEAWGRDQSYIRLWASLNLVLCAWLYRRTVLTQYSIKTPRLTREQFRKCLMALSADEHHLDWLVNRQIGIRNTGPAYNRIKSIFVARLADEFGKRPSLPQPEWAS